MFSTFESNESIRVAGFKRVVKADYTSCTCVIVGAGTRVTVRLTEDEYSKYSNLEGKEVDLAFDLADGKAGMMLVISSMTEAGAADASESKPTRTSRLGSSSLSNAA